MPTPFTPPPSDSSDIPFNPPACLACGACCFSNSEHYVPVTGSDYGRLADSAADWVTWKNNRAFMRMTGGHCAALQIEASDSGTQFICSIYEQRPQTCRDLERGSPQCHADWSLKRSG